MHGFREDFAVHPVLAKKSHRRANFFVDDMHNIGQAQIAKVKIRRDCLFSAACSAALQQKMLPGTSPLDFLSTFRL